MPAPGGVPVGLLVLVGVLGPVALVILIIVISMGVRALGTPADRAAADATLREAARLLGARYRARREIAWYRRPAQYGLVEGELGGRPYTMYLLPWNTEENGGCVMLRIGPVAPRAGATGRRGEVVAVIDERDWHWPDRAAAVDLAAHVRRAVARAATGAG